MQELSPQQLKKLEKLAKVLDNGDIELLNQLDNLETELTTKIEAVASQIPALRQAKDGERGIQGERGMPGADGKDGKDGIDGKDGKNGADGKNGLPGVDGKDGKDGKDGDIKDLSPQEIRDSLELLQGEERLKASAIDGLDKEVTDRAIGIVDQRTSFLINRINNLPTSSASLPDQSGNNGKFLTTDGANPSWATIAGGGDMLGSNNLSDLTDTTIARTNLGLGTAAVANTSDFASALGADDNYVTDAEKTALHTHSNKTVLDNTTASFTTADETKLDGIEAGAEVNVNADWNAVGGDSFIQNKPTIPDQLSDLTDDSTHRLVTDAEKTTWNAKLSSVKDTFGITIDGGVTVLTTGTKGYRYIEQNCTVTGWHVAANTTGSVVFDVKRSGSSIAGSEKPTLSSQQYNSDTALSTWTTSLTAGDIIEFVIDSASTITRATLTIVVTK